MGEPLTREEDLQAQLAWTTDRLEEVLEEPRQAGADPAELARTKQQLATTVQQLETTQQQLATTEQQLATTVQQLETTQQQLATTEQQLATTVQQLETTQQQLDAILQAQQRGIAAFPIAVLRGATSGFSDDNRIGHGGFGTVFRTNQQLPSLPHIGLCAVKRLDAGGMQGHNEVRSEIRVLSVCWHEHLLPLVGFCLDEATPFLCVSPDGGEASPLPLMPHHTCQPLSILQGNLESRVVNPPQGQQLSWQALATAVPAAPPPCAVPSITLRGAGARARHP